MCFELGQGAISPAPDSSCSPSLTAARTIHWFPASWIELWPKMCWGILVPDERQNMWLWLWLITFQCWTQLVYRIKCQSLWESLVWNAWKHVTDVDSGKRDGPGETSGHDKTSGACFTVCPCPAFDFSLAEIWMSLWKITLLLQVENQ